MRAKVLSPYVLSLVFVLFMATPSPSGAEDAVVSDDELAALAQDPEAVSRLDLNQLMAACSGSGKERWSTCWGTP